MLIRVAQSTAAVEEPSPHVQSSMGEPADDSLFSFMNESATAKLLTQLQLPCQLK